MRLAITDLFKAQWTDQIHEEWMGALLHDKKYSRETLERTRELMDLHIRDAKVIGYESIIASLALPDPDDRHVLAAAIHCNADAIVTFNLKDFPPEKLEPFGVEAIHPDDFIFYQIDMNPMVCCRAIRAQRMALNNPALDVDTFLSILQKLQLPQSVSKLKDFVDFL